MCSNHHLRVWLTRDTVVVQSLRHIWLFAISWTAACQASLSFIISQSLIKFMSIELVMPSNNLTSAYPFSFCFQSFPASESFPLSQHFASGSRTIGASYSASVFQCIFRVDLLRIDWFDLLAVQGTLKRLLRHRSLKASILQHAAFMV